MLWAWAHRLLPSRSFVSIEAETAALGGNAGGEAVCTLGSFAGAASPAKGATEACVRRSGLGRGGGTVSHQKKEQVQGGSTQELRLLGASGGGGEEEASS